MTTKGITEMIRPSCAEEEAERQRGQGSPLEEGFHPRQMGFELGFFPFSCCVAGTKSLYLPACGTFIYKPRIALRAAFEDSSKKQSA